MSGHLLLALLVVAFLSTVHAHDHDHEELLVESVDHQYVTCGSLIKLRHVDSGVRLHSHEVAYGSGSGQQSVTGLAHADDDGSYWLVREPFGASPCTTGQKFQRNDSFRLLHIHSGKYLHSHLHQSPLSRQQEVSAFGEGGSRSDSGDNWVVVPEGKEVYWLRGERVRIQHKDTQLLLDVSEQTFRHPIPGQREVVCSTRIPAHDTSSRAYWTADEGLYMPQSK